MKHEDIIKRFEEAQEYFQEDYERNRSDYEFALGDQWDDDIKSQRSREGRPCLTENRLLPFINQVVNNIRQTRPQVVIKPADKDADVDTAEVLEGLVRNIQNQNDAESCYDMAAFNAVAGGLGFIRIGTDYADYKSFDQEIKIDRILNPFAVLLDPNSTRQDASDAEYAFIYDDIPVDTFKEQYPDASLDDFGTKKDWRDNKTVRIAEYFYKEYEKKKLYRYEMLIGTQMQEGIGDVLPEGAVEIESRDVDICKVKYAKVNGKEILEENEFPSKYIPIVPVLGLEAWIDNKRRFYTLIHQAKDPQKMFNYWKTASAEIIALQPKAPWVIADGQVKGYEKIWQNANRVNSAFLPYKPITVDGVLAPQPQRQPAPTSSGSMMQEAMAAGDGIKASLGMYDASMGMQTPDISGKAIISRQMQGDNANFHFIDNLSTAMKHVGRILVDMIPRVYSNQRIIRILGEDGKESLVPLNTPVVSTKDGYTQATGVEPNAKLFKLGTGKYDVVVEVGQAYATKRQEAANAIIELAKVDPRFLEVGADILIKNMDIPEVDTLTKRIRAVMDASVLAEDAEAQKLVQAQEQLQMLQQKLDETELALQVKQEDQKFKNELELAKVENERTKLQIDAEKTMAEIEKIKAEITQQIPAEASKDVAEAMTTMQSELDDISEAFEMFLSSMEKKKATGMPEMPENEEE